MTDGDLPPLGLFAASGVELEYMIVHRERLDVFPAADRLLTAAAGELVEEYEDGPIGWSNELALHLVELKTARPAASLEGVADQFLGEVRHINTILAGMGGRLLPTAMHPWMNPSFEFRIWPHGYSEIYATYDRIFDCTGHGWSNLQSMHLNLPFADDREFRRLHSAIRLLLPLLPALAASSPIVQWEPTGFLDTRLEVYRGNAARIPTITGFVVPEVVGGREDYQRTILEPMYADIAPHDPDGVLQHEWLNSRGAIARFDRNAIEIRVLDTQETPAQDIAIAGAITAVLEALVAERWSSLGTQEEPETERLAGIFDSVIRDADHAVIRDVPYLKCLGYPERSGRAIDVWQHLVESVAGGDRYWEAGVRFILREGCLARRILRAVGPGCRRSRVREAWRVLAECLEENRAFEGI